MMARSLQYVISIAIHHPEFNPETKETSFWIHRILVRRACLADLPPTLLSRAQTPRTGGDNKTNLV